MLRQTLVATTATLALLAPAAVAEAGAPDHARASSGITGTWRGGVYGDAGGSAGYPAKVKISKKHGKLHGKVTYPGTCAGVWKYRGKKHGWFTFREVITKHASRCVTPVSAKAKRVGGKLKVVWREPQTGDQGHMTAHRV